MLFKILLSILSGLLTLSVSAAGFQCKKGDIAVPCEKSAWGIGGDALYFSRGTPGLIPSTGNQSYNFHPSWGLRLEASRYFNIGNDFTLNWVYLNVSEDFITNNASAVSNVFNIPAGGSFNQSSKLSWVNLELGQLFNQGALWEMRVHGGLEISHLSEATLLTDNNNRTIRDTSKANLVGVRIGTNIFYHAFQSGMIYMNGAVGGLYGSLQNAGPAGGITDSSNGNTTAASLVFNGVAISFDYGLGLNYLSKLETGELNTRLGWESYVITSILKEIVWQGLLFGTKWVGDI